MVPAALLVLLLLQECINLLKELGAPVEYIVLPTFAYEHKVFVGPFARRFPNAKVRQDDAVTSSWCAVPTAAAATGVKQ
jgi:hypothetical protein